MFSVVYYGFMFLMILGCTPLVFFAMFSFSVALSNFNPFRDWIFVKIFPHVYARSFFTNRMNGLLLT